MKTLAELGFVESIMFEMCGDKLENRRNVWSREVPDEHNTHDRITINMYYKGITLEREHSYLKFNSLFHPMPVDQELLLAIAHEVNQKF